MNFGSGIPPWRRVCIFDPGFTKQFGHHYTYNCLVRDALAARGALGRFFFTCHLPDELAALFPGCSRSSSVRFYERPLENESRVQELHRRALRHAEELLKCAGEAAYRDSLLFAHTLDPAALLGIALWRESLSSSRRPWVALNVMLGFYDNEEECRELLVEAVTLLNGQGGAFLFGGCRAVADVLEKLTGKEGRVLPTPLPYGIFDRGAHKDKGSADRGNGEEGGVVYGVLGEVRLDKNMHILPAAIVRYLALGGKGSFEIRVTPTEEKLVDSMVLLHDLSREKPERVRLSFDHLGVDEYYDKMAACGALLVPYHYGRFRPSGLVIESAVLGVPVVGLRGGILEEELTGIDNGSLFFEQASAGHLADALLRFDGESAERLEKARDAARAYAPRHGIDALLQALGYATV